MNDVPDDVGATKVTFEIAATVGKVLREPVSHSVSIRDIGNERSQSTTRGAPPAVFGDEEYTTARLSKHARKWGQNRSRSSSRDIR